MPESRTALEVKGLEKLTKRDRKVLEQRANEAREEGRAEARRQREHRAEFEANRAESEQRCRSVDEHSRRMEARDKVAADLAQRLRVSHTDAQRLVIESLQRGDRRR